jgi:hypothetical protein
MKQARTGQSLIEFVLSLNLVVLMLSFAISALSHTLLALFLKTDLYELARVRAYGVETFCKPSRHWPELLFRVEFRCDTQKEHYQAELHFKFLTSSKWKLHEEIQWR